MGRRARLKQGPPEPLEAAPKRDSGFVRSGGKRKRILPEAEARAEKKLAKKLKREEKIRAHKGKGKATEADDGFDEVDQEEEQGLKAAREAYFEPEDLIEGGLADEAEGSDGSSSAGAMVIEEDLNDLPNGDEFEENAPDEMVQMDLRNGKPRPAVLRAPILAGSDDVSDEDDDTEDELPSTSANAISADDEEGDGPAVNGKQSVHVVRRRMETAARILSDWKDLGAKSGKSRAEMMQQFVTDVVDYFGYNEFLAEKLIDLFPTDEALAFFEASDTPRPITIRTNTLRTRRRELAQTLINRGINLEPIGKWSKVGLQIFESQVPVGATPEYLAGHYMLQATCSFLPVIALAPQPNERILDMSAAPGGKTSYISALLQNTGMVFANDSNKTRIKSLAANIARMGCKNVVICNHDGRDFPGVLGGFDRVLLDAPCSGTGVVSKDPSIKMNKSHRDFQLLSHLQKQLILAAIDSVSPTSATGGYLVYSTCSVTVDENEAVVAYALRKRPHVKLVDAMLPFGREGLRNYKGTDFGESMKLTRRVYPHVNNCDGFFVAKLKVGKASKKAPVVVEAETENDAVFGLQDYSMEDDGPAFNDEEDRKLIIEGRRAATKKKGVKVHPRKSG